MSNDDNDTQPAATEEWSGTNLAGDVVEAGIHKHKPEFQEDLRWYWRFSYEQGLSQTEAAGDLGVDAGTYSKVLRGEYKNAQGLLLAPPAKMLSRIRVLREQARENALKRGGDRIMTQTVAEIHAVCRKVWADRQIGLIFGESHIGKTEALTWFRDENNHGSTLYIDLQGVQGVQDVYRAFARALRLSVDTPIAKLMPRVFATIDRTNLVLVDEFHHITYAYQKGASNRMVNALKSIKDRTGCAMVICATNVARDEFTEGKGREAKLLKQLWRRGVTKLQLPDALRVADVRAVAEANGLPFPAAPAKGDDLWKRLAAEHPDAPGRALCERIAYESGILHLITVMKDGAKLAAKRSRDLTWADVERAQAAYDNWAAKKAV